MQSVSLLSESLLLGEGRGHMAAVLHTRVEMGVVRLALPMGCAGLWAFQAAAGGGKGLARGREDLLAI